MKIGLVGFPGSGKTTVFNAITGLSAETGMGASRGKTNLGVVKVPDPRIDKLAEIYKPKKKTYAEVTFSDIAAGAGAQGLDRNVLNSMREVDALCQVVRAFNDPAQPTPPNPLQEAIDLEVETILADLELVEKRLERIKKEKANPRELAALEKLKEHLDASKPLRSLQLPEEDWNLFVSLRFLSLKPLLLVLNVDEDQVAAPPPAEIEQFAKDRGLGLVVLSAKVEEDIAHMDPADQKEFVSSLGLEEPARDRFIRSAFALLDLISFLTAGEDDCRAWPVRRGLTAHKAAGKIHSDIERGFIRAEVVHFEDLVALKSEAKAREAGKLRLEGKEYVVQDGDVINFRFNV
ncbi:MAG: redox-regulated ATPase YchF [Myxococcales bacterium]|jgi:GTP-binding protein YchF